MNLKDFSGRISKRLIRCSTAVLASGVLVCTGQAQVTPVTLTSGNSSATVDVNSDLGMYNWSVSGLNQLQQQWFWFRVGSGPQAPINTISAASWTQPTSDVLHTTYANGSYSVTVNYTLKDGPTGKSSIAESITIHNTSGGLLDFHFYQYSDFDLGGTPTGDEVWIDNTQAFQQKGTSAIAEGIIDPEASHYEANTVGGTGSTLYGLQNTSDFVLRDLPYNYASGNVTWAYQWDFVNMADNASAEILKGKDLSLTLVPEPASLTLIALGLGAWGLARRRR